ncbi:MAG: hypothetical protein BroJett013_21300 [Alphaproteobacteria bacterium]|nr:MAG: hypothetical protein BroJett013_21300 [Alphaproteobacteria bacterium]
MAATFDYAVLTAVPDPRRGERVNIGVVVFRADRIDVRLESVAYKLRALTGNNLESRLESAQARYRSLFVEGQEPAVALRRIAGVEPLLKPSELGRFVASNELEYEARIADILKSLVTVPKRERGETRSRINTEMAWDFRKANILAETTEGVVHGKVVRNYTVDDSEGLVADFALKNGKLHVTSTLDLRKASAGISQAALKSIILDRAKKKNKKTKTIGVYAVDPDMKDMFRQQLNLLAEYSDEMFDWTDRNSRRKLGHLFEDAIGLPPGGLF